MPLVVMARRPKQQELFPRPSRPARRSPKRASCVPHMVRPHHDYRHPIHVTMRRATGRSSLRKELTYAAIKAQIARAVQRGVRVIHYSIQHDHVHLIIEAADRVRASRDMQLLFSRLALETNRVERRHGKLFADRHHRRPLTTPREMRNCLVYVMFNDRKHASSFAELTREGGWFDTCSSALWFVDWDPRARPPPQRDVELSPLAPAQTWLAQTGWKNGGLIRFDERPRSAP
jgi:putative transposase